MSYSDPIFETRVVKANAGVSSAAVMDRFIGPAGMKGRLVACSTVVTTGVTVAAGVIGIDEAGQTANEFFSTSVPVSSANACLSATRAQLDAAKEFAADTAYDVYGDGGATAGAVDLVYTIAWYR